MDEPFDGGAGSGDQPPAPAVVVPDDARELARDVAAWRREERWLRRRHRLERLLLVDRPRRGWLAVLFLAASVAVLGLAVATLPLFTPHAARPGATPVPLTLAAPSVPTGDVGGLVPDASLAGTSGTTAARDLRPVLFALAGNRCSCADALARLARQAATNSLPVVLVGAPTGGDSADQLLAEVSSSTTGDLRALTDVSGGLTQAFAPAPGTLAIVAVHADGVIAEVVTNYTTKTALGPLLATLQQPGG